MIFFFFSPHKESLCSASSFKDVLAVRFNPDGQWQRADVLILSDDAKGRGNGEEYVKELPISCIFSMCLSKKKETRGKNSPIVSLFKFSRSHFGQFSPNLIFFMRFST